MVNEFVINAAKYSDPEAPKKVIYLTLFEDGELVRVIVADNGVGISDPAAALAGKRLRRDMAGGYGLGLRGVKNQADKHNIKFDINPDLSDIQVPQKVKQGLDGMKTVMMLTMKKAEVSDDR